MPEKKKQHFVSKFLLKRFSSDDEKAFINLHNLKSGKAINVPIKPQAQEEYYYGSDLILENYLETTEVKAALVIEEMLIKGCVPPFDDLKFQELLHFIMLYEWRTKASVDQTEEYLNAMFREVSKYDSRLKAFDFDKHRLKHKEPAAFNLSYYMDSWVVAADLIPFLLVNLTEKHFIMSDNPLIKYNPFMQHRQSYWASASILSKGLIYLFPLSPRHYIMLVDPTTYDVKSNEADLIAITDESDIDQINILQAISADQNIYFAAPEQENYIASLAKEAAKNKIDKLQTQLLNNPQKPGSNSLFAYQLVHKLEFFFSFIREGKEAGAYDTNEKLFHPRNQAIVDHVMNMKDKSFE